jgi:hypothetical protein
MKLVWIGSGILALGVCLVLPAGQVGGRTPTPEPITSRRKPIGPAAKIVAAAQIEAAEAAVYTDHRRVPNQIHFFRRFGKTLAKSTKGVHRGEWLPGDIVYWRLPSGLDHAGIVSDRLGPTGLPMVIHNLSVCREEDVLGAWTIQGHYRFPR